MDSIIIGAAGLCFGVLTARACVPRTQLLPLVCSLALSLIGVVPLILGSSGSLLNGLIFTFAVLISAAVYGAELWRRTGLGQEFSLWQLIWIGLWRPRYLRAAYEADAKSAENQLEGASKQ